MTISILLLFLLFLLIIFLYNYNIGNYLGKNSEFEQNLNIKNNSNINISFTPISIDKHHFDGELIFGGLSIELVKKDKQKIKILENTEYYNFKINLKKNFFNVILDNKIILTLEYFIRIILNKNYFINIEIPKKFINEKEKIIFKNYGNSKILINNITLTELKANKNNVLNEKKSIEGYINKNSYFVDEEIEIKCHSIFKEFNIEFYKYPELNKKIILLKNILGFKQKNNFEPYLNGAGWETTKKFKIPKNWSSGLYMIKLYDLKSEFYFSFVIKDKISKEITILTPTNTWQAYNDWGGSSFYNYNLNKKIKKTNTNILHMLRPNPFSSPFQKSGHLADQEIFFYKWITENKYDYSTIDDLDLHNNYDLSNTKILVINNHSEYWTENMLINLENYLSKSGNLINLSGNNLFWKSVINNFKIETIKHLSLHSLKNEKSGMWKYLNKSEASILGSSYDIRGYKTFAPYKAILKNHWALKDINLDSDNLFGFNNLTKKHASGYETNKIDYFSPKNVELIAKGTNIKNGGADMTFYTNNFGGKIFSTGSISYCSCLQSDLTCSKILKNVFDKFLNK